MNSAKIHVPRLILLCAVLLAAACTENVRELPSSGIWLGPEFWANPLQDWARNGDRLECRISGGERNVTLLTRALRPEAGTLDMRVEVGQLDPSDSLAQGWVGFWIGKRGEFNDYRDDAVRGIGYPAGITTDGRLFLGTPKAAPAASLPPFDSLTLQLTARPEEQGYALKLVLSRSGGEPIDSVRADAVPADWLHGGVALVCSGGPLPETPAHRPAIDDGNWGTRPGTGRGGNVRFWFRNWKIAGSKVAEYPERAYGPILFSMHTVSGGILKLTAQMAPVAGNAHARLEVQSAGGEWQEIGTAPVDPLARTARFRVDNWVGDRDVPYRLRYAMQDGSGAFRDHEFKGTIRMEPTEKDEIVLAGFTGNNDLGFPNNDITAQLQRHDPDLLFFSGDQLYEGVGGYGVQRSPLHAATLDYLRKWYIFGWTYRDLLRDRPSVAITDDHDVYHGNIWGAAGKAAPPGLTGAAAQDAGGYKQPAAWVNMVQRTQTSHLPDPPDPEPVEQGIGVYFTSMDYSGISFAILEDRKFKSAPKPLLPGAEIHNGWAQNPEFNPKTEADIAGAVLLGDRQLAFLESWAADWDDGIWMKAVLSQTIFANVATLPRADAMHDRIVPKLRILNQNEYAPDDVPVADMDSNGWPQSGRNRALRAIRKAFAVHIAGDQHLGSTIQYGIEAHRDAGFAFCVPAVSNVWPRRWYPSVKGANPLPGQPRYTGDFEDGFGNRISVHAVSNPVFTGRTPSRLYDRATGYGLVRFNRRTREITMECWPRVTDHNAKRNGQYPGWPITIDQLDNYGASANLFLPTLRFVSGGDAVVQVVDEQNEEILYTIRVANKAFRPPVLRDGRYSVRVQPGDGDKPAIYRGLAPSAGGSVEDIVID